MRLLRPGFFTFCITDSLFIVYNDGGFMNKFFVKYSRSQFHTLITFPCMRVLKSKEMCIFLQNDICMFYINSFVLFHLAFLKETVND